MYTTTFPRKGQNKQNNKNQPWEGGGKGKPGGSRKKENWERAGTTLNFKDLTSRGPKIKTPQVTKTLREESRGGFTDNQKKDQPFCFGRQKRVCKTGSAIEKPRTQKDRDETNQNTNFHEHKGDNQQKKKLQRKNNQRGREKQKRSLRERRNGVRAFKDPNRASQRKKRGA